jgi:hypothetical protein
MIVRGKCHCGNIAFSLTWDPDPPEIQARVCDCTFCQKHGGVWTSNPQGALEVVIQDRSRVSRYAFATGTADFHICARCGVVPIVSCTLDGRVYAVVNVNTFDNVDPAMVRKAPITFEGEEMGSRLARRKRNWIADVRFT